MPSLHFGYSFIIGLTIATMPNVRATNIRRRLMLIAAGMAYPTMILIAILATANHFVLDAVAGFFVAVAGWHVNGVLVNLLPLEDWFFNLLHVHKPDHEEARDGTASPVGDGKIGPEEEWWRRA